MVKSRFLDFARNDNIWHHLIARDIHHVRNRKMRYSSHPLQKRTYLNPYVTNGINIPEILSCGCDKYRTRSQIDQNSVYQKMISWKETTMLEIRPYEASDISAVVSLLNRCLTSDPITSEAFQLKVLLDPNFAKFGALVAEIDSKIIGFVLGIVRKNMLEDAAPDFDRSWVTLIAVDAEHRRSRVGTMLLDWIEEYLSLHGCESIWVSPYAPNYFTPGIDVNAYPEALAFFRSRGYEEAYKPLAMSVDLTGPTLAAAKEGLLQRSSVTIEPFRPELILPILDFMKLEFPGDWQRHARETMGKIATGDFRSDNLWVACEQEKVIGYCQHDNNGRFGPFGVSAKGRGKGIGAALLFKCLNAMRDKGLKNAWFMWTDDKAAALYARAGFVETRRFAVLTKKLPAA